MVPFARIGNRRRRENYGAGHLYHLSHVTFKDVLLLDCALKFTLLPHILK